MSDVSVILSQIEAGNPTAASKLLPLVYDELRRLAAAKIALENPGQTLQATALVHEAFVRLVNAPAEQTVSPVLWDGRGHFFAAAAEAMRRILVENARRKRRTKHGGEFSRQDVPDPDASDVHEEIEALDAALNRLKGINSQAVELVHLRYFAGLSMDDAAELLGISPRTAARLWAYARAWLHQEISGDSPSHSSD
jgi:RNA polymerase sigma factor (TIGR02999 family)